MCERIEEIVASSIGMVDVREPSIRELERLNRETYGSSLILRFEDVASAAPNDGAIQHRERIDAIALDALEVALEVRDLRHREASDAPQRFLMVQGLGENAARIAEEAVASLGRCPLSLCIRRICQRFIRLLV